MRDHAEFSTAEDDNNPGWQARIANGYLVNPPPRYRPEPKPKASKGPAWWTGHGPYPVRCSDCAHWRGRHGWCPVARKQARSARAWRRCDAFEPRAVQAQERPVEASAPPEVRTHRPEPIERVRRRLVELGMLDLLSELVSIGGGSVGVRFRPGLSDLETIEVHGVIEAALLAAAMDDRAGAA